MAKKSIGDTAIAPTAAPKGERQAETSRAWEGAGVERKDETEKMQRETYLMPPVLSAEVRGVAAGIEARRKAAAGKVDVPGGGATRRRVTPSTLVRIALIEYFEKYKAELGL